jgi:hypothetical protein
MICAQCLLFEDEVPAVTQVGAVAVCAEHARAMLLNAPIRPLAQLKIRKAAEELKNDIAPAPTNNNPQFTEVGGVTT